MKKIAMWKYPGRWSVFQFDDRLLLILTGAFVGICSGLASLALYFSLEFLQEEIHHLRIYWWAFLLPAAGAALSSLFLEKVVNEGAGHGVPEVIYSVSKYGGLIRFRSSFSRLISSCLTIGSGGSAGPEAPVVMSGAAIGSNIAKFFSFNDRQRVTLVGCGAAGAIAAIFNAPIVGMVFVLEVVLGEWSAVNIIPIAIAAVAGTQVSHVLKGNQIAFSHQSFNISFADIVACIGLAVLCALVSILLTRFLRNMHGVAGKVKVPMWVKAAMGGAMAGIVGIYFPDVLGEGYSAIASMISGNYTQGLLLVSIMVLAKILATSLTLSWGGSGGVFAPCLVIGSFAGVSFHRLIVLLFPGIAWTGEGCFALLGMAGLISGILQAPLTGIFLVVEITGSYEVMLPLIIVSSLSTTLCNYFEPASFYLKDLIDRGQLLRPGTDARVLTDLSIVELLEKDCISVRSDMLLRDFVEIVKQSHRNHFPVEDPATGTFAGMIHFDDVRPYLFDSMMYDVVVLEQIMDSQVVTVHVDTELPEVLRIMDEKKLFSLPVLIDNKFVGMISKGTLLDKYRKELMVQTVR